MENPALRLEFDMKRQKQQQREIENTDQFKLIQYGFCHHKSKYLLKAQAENIRKEQQKLTQEQQEQQVQDEDELPKYASVSLCCLSSSNPFRNKIILLVTKNQWFDRFILLIILLNTLFLALDQEVNIVTKYNEQIDFTFLIIYTFEMVLKIVALGFIMNTNSYIRDPWNILDFTVVFCGWLSQDQNIQDIQYVKILRILRPLKVIKKVPGMPKLVKTIIDSLPAMFDVFILFMFSLFFFGIIATQTLGGDLESSCVGMIDGQQIIKLGEKEKRFLCRSQSACDDLTKSNKYEGGPFVCKNVGNPDAGQLSYDNILISILNIFQAITLVGWCDQMYWIRGALNSFDYDIFFLFIVFFGNFIILVLLINVQAFFLDQAFDLDEKIIEEKKQKFEIKQQTDKQYENYIFEQVSDLNNNEINQKKQEFKVKQKCLRFNQKFINIFPPKIIEYQTQVEDFCEKNEYFSSTIIVIIVLNTFCMASEYYDQPEWLTQAQQIANYIFTAAFTIEMILKMFGKGLLGYFKDGFNSFDCFVVLMSYLDISLSQNGSNLGVIKAFRLLRIFKLIQKWPKFRKLIFTLSDSIKPIINLGILMILFLFISALLMKNICQKQIVDEDGNKTRYGFDTTAQSLVTMFILLTGDLWTDIMHNTVSSQNNNFSFSLLFVFLLTLGHFMLLNLFLAVLLRAISNDDKKEEEEKIEKEERKQELEFEEKNELDDLQNQIINQIKKEQTNIDDQIPSTERQLLSRKTVFLDRLQQIEEEFNFDKDDALIEIVKEIEQEIKEGRERIIDLDQSDVEKEFQIIQNHLFDNCGNLKKNEQGEIVHSLNLIQNLTKILREKVEHEKTIQKQVEKPDNSLFIFSKQNQIRIIATNIIENPYFESFINHIIGLSCLLIAIDQPEQPYMFGLQDSPYWPQQPVVQDNFQKQVISFLINITSFVLVCEFILKVISKGFFIGDKSYLRDPFNILDFIIVIFSVLTWILEQLIGKNNDYVKMFRSLGAIRPLRFVSQNQSLKMVVNSIFKSLPELFSVTLIVMLFILVFGILGVQLFKGELGSCSISDPSIMTKEDCLNYIASSNSSLRLLQSNNITSLNLQNLTIQSNLTNMSSSNNSNLTNNNTITSDSMQQQNIQANQSLNNQISVNSTQQQSQANDTSSQTANELQPQWIRKPQNYDNIFWSMLTFFEITTFEGWVQMMFDATDGVGYDIAMQDQNQNWVQLIYILYIFIMTFFVMNLFISVIFEKFKDEYREYEGSIKLQPNEREWVKIQKLMLLSEPKIVPPEPVNKVRRYFYNIVQTQLFDYMSILVISLNALLFCIYHANEPEIIDNLLYVSNYAIVIYFTLEIIFKIIAYGFVIFQSQIWNKFDAIVIAISIFSLSENFFSSIGVDISLIKIFRVLRLLRIIKNSKGIRKLLKTLLMSLRNIVNVFILLILLWFVFSIIGMNLFSLQEFGDAYNKDANFTSFYISMYLIIRCSTGEGWNDIMHEMYEQFGFKAIFYWIIFTLIVFFVLMNVFIAVIGNSYDDNQENTDLNDVLSIKKSDLKKFVDTWAKFNPGGEQMMKTLRLPQFLMELPPPLGYRGIYLKRHMVDQILQCLNIRDRCGFVYYPEVMWAIFHALGGYNTSGVVNCQIIKNILKDVKKKFKNLSIIEKEKVVFIKETNQKQTFKEVEKIKVTLDSLCGNKYLIDDLSAIQYIKVMRGLKHFRKRKINNYQQKEVYIYTQ